MRLSEDRIKEAILDTDLELRQRAIQYFVKSFSTDTTVMPLVIKAVETFGREEAYHVIGQSRDLAQTKDTINWILDELNNSQSDQYENHTPLKSSSKDRPAPLKQETIHLHQCWTIGKSVGTPRAPVAVERSSRSAA